MKTTEIYNKFYEMLYNGTIEEDTISLTDIECCIERRSEEFSELCQELQDVPVSDRERAAFYLTMNFIFA